MQLSIIIVTYNPGDIIAQCLDSVFAEIKDIEAEVIVVDNVSQDGTPERIERDYPQVYLIRSAENRGFAAGNNQGLAVASGTYLLLLNPDVILHPESLRTVVMYLDANPKVGIAGARIINDDGKIAPSAHAPFNALTILWNYLGFDRLFPYHIYGRYRHACETASEPFSTFWLQGAFLMMRHAVYQQIGGLDERFFLFAEEPDLCDRTLKAGWQIHYVPQASITHYESSTVARYHLRRVRWYHLSALHYFRKRNQEITVFILKLGFTLELAVKVLIRLLQALRGKREQERLNAYWKVLGEVWRY